MSDPRLDRRVEFDERSRKYAVRDILTGAQLEAVPRSYTWRVPVALDQGSEGACVGFAWAQELAARPWPDDSITDADALMIYREAKKVDAWPGEDYEGTSVLAGAKVCHAMGRILEYRWAFSFDDLKRAVGYKGPAVLGVNWYTGMFRPDSDGRIRPTGWLEGGHAILLPRVTGPRYGWRDRRHRNYVYNSWGRAHGWPWAWLSDDDLERLLYEAGEACIPVIRR